VFDTHAGAGLYDLSGDGARSKEAEAGVARLMSAEGRTPLMDALAGEVAALNPDGGSRFYPGSPLLIADALTPGGRYVGFELNPPVRAMLAEALAGRANAQAREGDGYAAVARRRRRCKRAAGPDRPTVRKARRLCPLGRDRDFGGEARSDGDGGDLDAAEGSGDLRRLYPAAAGQGGATLVAEARLRPLTNPMKMNGCALVVVNPPAGAEAAATEICGWVAGALGEAGGRAEVWTF
jgi:23S rRNA (adenine2030-N6)-methyltransferase